MFVTLIFVALMTMRFASAQPIPSSSSDSNENFTPDSNFIESTQEYVNLHLVNDLSKASEFSQTLDGRNWLRAWQNKRTAVLKKILLFYNEDTGKFQWYSNHRQRLYHFEMLQLKYHRNLYSNYDIYNADSVPKITYNMFSDEITLHHPNPNQPTSSNPNIANPIATEQNVDRVLSYYRPYNDLERDLLNQAEAERQSSIQQQRSQNHEDIAIVPGIQDLAALRSQLKKYYIIDPQIIRNLQKTRYKLLRENLIGKRTSDLHYHSALLLGERIADQIDVWENNNINRKTDTRNQLIFKALLPIDMQILRDVEIYRSFANVEEKYFKGNILYGQINRYDDPITNNYGFEVTSEVIIGKRYKPMYDLFDEIHEFSLKTRNFATCKLKDLPTIELFFERFKTWTLWFNPSPYRLDQWFSRKTITGNDIYMIVPKRSRNRNTDLMFDEVEATLRRTKNPKIVIDLTQDRSLRFVTQMSKDKFLIKQFKKKNQYYGSMNVWTNRVMHYFNSLKTTLLPLLSPQTQWLDNELSKYHQKLVPKQDLPESKEKQKRNVHDDKSIDFGFETFKDKDVVDFDKFMANLDDLFFAQKKDNKKILKRPAQLKLVINPNEIEHLVEEIFDSSVNRFIDKENKKYPSFDLDSRLNRVDKYGTGGDGPGGHHDSHGANNFLPDNDPSKLLSDSNFSHNKRPKHY